MRESWTVTLPPLDIDASPDLVSPPPSSLDAAAEPPGSPELPSVTPSRAVPDALGAAAIELARAAAVLDAGLGGASQVGEHVAVEADAERIVTHYFECIDRGYVGWRWAVTVVRAPRAKLVTVDEVVLLPGPGALLAPAWVPWSERLQPGDLGVGDVLPTADDDPRLDQGYFGFDTRDVVADVEDLETLDTLIRELGLGRPRVLSDLGRIEAADRWYDGEHGPAAPIAKAADLPCSTCGFMVMMRGALSRMFGVCANEYAPDDGRVVSYDHGCGAHSEALVVHDGPLAEAPAAPIDGAPDFDVTASFDLDGFEPDSIDPEDTIDTVEPITDSTDVTESS
jgi:hypothetical protein